MTFKLFITFLGFNFTQFFFEEELGHDIKFDQYDTLKFYHPNPVERVLSGITYKNDSQNKIISNYLISKSYADTAEYLAAYSLRIFNDEYYIRGRKIYELNSVGFPTKESEEVVFEDGTFQAKSFYSEYNYKDGKLVEIKHFSSERNPELTYTKIRSNILWIG